MQHPAWVQGCLGTGLPGYGVAWVRGCLGTGLGLRELQHHPQSQAWVWGWGSGNSSTTLSLKPRQLSGRTRWTYGKGNCTVSMAAVVLDLQLQTPILQRGKLYGDYCYQ